MSYKCIHKKFGTILYRKGGDPLISLSWALGNQRQHEVMDQPSDYYITTESTAEIVLEQAGCIINDLIHKEIERISNDKIIDDPHMFNMETSINRIELQLWKFLETATSTIRQKSRSESTPDHKKRIRQSFIFCLLIYCTNSNKPIFMHILLVDAVEMHGGS